MMKKVMFLARQWQKQFLIAILLFATGGCLRPPQEPAMTAEIPSSFSTTGTEPLLEQWWRAFADDELDGLIDQALTGNFDLRTGWDRLAQAQALAQRTEASLWPQADLTAEARRSRQDVDDAVSYSNLYSVGLRAGYEVDLWSQLNSLAAGARLDAEAQRERVNVAAITLAASIANTWYELAAAKARVRITQEQIQANQNVLKIVTIRWRKGAARAADLYRQRQLVAATEAQLIVAAEAVELLQYQLCVLIGERPKLAWEQTSLDLPDLPGSPHLGVPAEVLLRRPDVRQSYRQIQAADRRLAAAIADQYPRISISASVETSSRTSVRDLFDDWLANLAANALQPIFDRGQRKAEVQRQRAIVSERINTWRQAILDALQEVESALTEERQQAQLLENLKYQLTLARQTYRRNRASYIKGQVDYIRVLESLQSMQALEHNVITAQRLLIGRRIDLYRSIAGSFDLPQPEPARTDSLTEATAKSGNVNGDQ